MTCPPASSASQDARRTLSSVDSSPVSRITLRWAAPARLPDRDDLLVHLQVAAGEEGAAVDDHVDLVRAGGDRLPGVGELDRQAGPPGRERGGHAGHLDRRPGQLGLRDRHQVRVDADRRDRRRARVGRVRLAGLGAQRPHLARGVRALQRGQVDAPDGQVQRPLLGLLLDAPGRQRRRPRLRADLVHARAARAGSGAASSRPAPRPRTTPLWPSPPDPNPAPTPLRRARPALLGGWSDDFRALEAERGTTRPCMRLVRAAPLTYERGETRAPPAPRGRKSGRTSARGA